MFDYFSETENENVLNKDPIAYAEVKGDAAGNTIHGIVKFYNFLNGTIVEAEFRGLPVGTGECSNNFYGFHIHVGSSCTGEEQDPYRDTGLHWNPNNCTHPSHAGDLPVVLSSDGVAWTAFFTDQFTPEEVIGRTIILHDMPDDYRSQPAGDAQNKIACGEIKAY